jgi:hypothetical protein
MNLTSLHLSTEKSDVTELAEAKQGNNEVFHSSAIILLFFICY